MKNNEKISLRAIKSANLKCSYYNLFWDLNLQTHCLFFLNALNYKPFHFYPKVNHASSQISIKIKKKELFLLNYSQSQSNYIYFDLYLVFILIDLIAMNMMHTLDQLASFVLLRAVIGYLSFTIPNCLLLLFPFIFAFFSLFIKFGLAALFCYSHTVLVPLFQELIINQYRFLFPLFHCQNS